MKTDISPQICPIDYPTDKPRHVYVCENSPEGILSGVYDAWVSRYGHSHNYIQIADNLECNIFYEYINVETDYDKAVNISTAVKHKISYNFYELLYTCLQSSDPDRADDIYRLIILGFAIGDSARSCLAYPPIQRIMKLQKNVWNETHHYMGFLRFEELSNGYMFARFRPQNDICSTLILHFADRFPEENILIADVGRRKIALSKHGKTGLVSNPDIDFEHFDYLISYSEKMFRDLWKTFTDSIVIKERSNIKLQQQLMPLRFREFM